MRLKKTFKSSWYGIYISSPVINRIWAGKSLRTLQILGFCGQRDFPYREILYFPVLCLIFPFLGSRTSLDTKAWFYLETKCWINHSWSNESLFQLSYVIFFLKFTLTRESLKFLVTLSRNLFHFNLTLGN